MNNYENLIKEKETLENRLAIVTKELQTLEKVVYKGKAEKIITLMYELSPHCKNTPIYNLYMSDIDTDELYSINLYELTQILEDFFKNF